MKYLDLSEKLEDIYNHNLYLDEDVEILTVSGSRYVIDRVDFIRDRYVIIARSK